MAESKETTKAIEEKAREIGKKIHSALPEGWGFVLLVVEFDPGKQASYISDCSRACTIHALREVADRLEKEGG